MRRDRGIPCHLFACLPFRSAAQRCFMRGPARARPPGAGAGARRGRCGSRCNHRRYCWRRQGRGDWRRNRGRRRRAQWCRRSECESTGLLRSAAWLWSASSRLLRPAASWLLSSSACWLLRSATRCYCRINQHRSAASSGLRAAVLSWAGLHMDTRLLGVRRWLLLGPWHLGASACCGPSLDSRLLGL